MRHASDQAGGGGGRLNRSQIVRYRLPRPLLRPRPFECREVPAPLIPPGRPDRRRAKAVRADQLCREALRKLRREQRINEGPQCRVGVHVDKSRAQQESIGLDQLAACVNGQAFAHCSDPPSADRYIGEAHRVVAVGNPSTPDHEIGLHRPQT